MVLDKEEEGFNEIESVWKEYGYDLGYERILGDV